METRYTTGVSTNILKSIQTAIDRNNEEAFKELIQFVFSTLHLSIRKKSLNHFIEYCHHPSNWYASAFLKYKADGRASKIFDIGSTFAAQGLQTLLYDIQSSEIKSKQSIAEREFINKYYYWNYTAFGRLLLYYVINLDIKNFNHGIKLIREIMDSHDSGYELQRNISEIKRNNIDGKNDQEIKMLEYKRDVIQQPDVFRRHLLRCIKFFIYYRFHIGKISAEELGRFTLKLNLDHSNSEDNFKDILFFHSNSFVQYLGLETWSFIDRNTEDEHYGPDMVNWITLGFLIEQLKGNRVFINTSELSSDNLKGLYSLYHSIKHNLNQIRIELTRWEPILNIKTANEFEVLANEIISPFEKAIKQPVTRMDREIINVPLSETKVTDFIQSVGATWKRNARVRWLFKQNKNFDTNPNKSTKRVIRTGYFPKSMFVDGNLYVPAFGFETIGGEIAKSEDDHFIFLTFNNSRNIIKGVDVVEVIENSIKSIVSKGYKPDIIILSPEFSYEEPKLLNDPRFSSQLRGLPNLDIPAFNIGSFDNIPIYSSFSEYLNNKVLVSEFSKAFSMNFKTNPNWFENELQILVEEINDERAKEILKNERDRWTIRGEDRIELNENDALVLIKSHVYIEVYSTLNYSIINHDAFVTAQIIVSEENLVNSKYNPSF